MVRQKNYPKVFLYNGVYTDVSLTMLEYGRDSVVTALDVGDFLYFGRVKPFDSLYVEMKVNNSVATTMVIEYYNGSAWTPVAALVDNTNCFKRSGFLAFDKPEDWISTSVNTSAQFWVRISVLAALSVSTEMQGLNIVFSDDQDLISVYPGITNYLDASSPGGETSFILRHANSRDKIIQDIRNQGQRKTPNGVNHYVQFDEWDVLHVEEVRLWSVFLTLQNIFSSLQSKDNDFYTEKATEYYKDSEIYKAAFYLSLDQDDDGLNDDAEEATDITTVRLVRR